MALVIKLVERVNSAPCQHFRVTAEVDGQRVSWIEQGGEKVTGDVEDLAREAFRLYSGGVMPDITTDVVLVPDAPTKPEEPRPVRVGLFARAMNFVGLG